MTAWNKIIFFSRSFMFLAAFTGIYLEITKHGGFGMLLYYTVLSNLLVMIFTGYLLWKMRREGDHNIDCKIDGFGAMKLKSEFVKKI